MRRDDADKRPPAERRPQHCTEFLRGEHLHRCCGEPSELQAWQHPSPRPQPQMKPNGCPWKISCLGHWCLRGSGSRLLRTAPIHDESQLGDNFDWPCPRTMNAFLGHRQRVDQSWWSRKCCEVLVRAKAGAGFNYCLLEGGCMRAQAETQSVDMLQHSQLPV